MENGKMKTEHLLKLILIGPTIMAVHNQLDRMSDFAKDKKAEFEKDKSGEKHEDLVLRSGELADEVFLRIEEIIQKYWSQTGKKFEPKTTPEKI